MNFPEQTAENKMPQIPPKSVMSAEAAAYPKLSKIYQELNKQNGIIFDAERERNALELERDSLKGLARRVHRRLQNYQRENADWQSESTIQRKDRRTR